MQILSADGSIELKFLIIFVCFCFIYPYGMTGESSDSQMGSPLKSFWHGYNCVSIHSVLILHFVTSYLYNLYWCEYNQSLLNQLIDTYFNLVSVKLYKCIKAFYINESIHVLSLSQVNCLACFWSKPIATHGLMYKCHL